MKLLGYPGNQDVVKSFLKLARSQEFARESHLQRLKRRGVSDRDVTC